jgi:hypothetical protein
MNSAAVPFHCCTIQPRTIGLTRVIFKVWESKYFLLTDLKSTKAYSSQAGKWLTVDITSATSKEAFPFNTGDSPLNYSGNPRVK